MRRLGALTPAVAASLATAAVSMSGCALFYGYGGYHAEGGGGAGGASSSSSSGQGGEGGEGGSAGGGGGQGGASCKLIADSHYGVTWKQVFARDPAGTVAGVHVDAQDLVSFAASFKGSTDVGGVAVASGAHRAALFAQFKPTTGTASFASAFGGDTDVLATALAVESNGDLNGFGTFTSKLTLGSTVFVAPPQDESFAFEVEIDKQTGQVTTNPETRQITCTPVNTKCSVSVSSAHFVGSDLLLAGGVEGVAYFSSSQMANTKVSANDPDGFAALYGNKALSLAGTGQQTMTDIGENDQQVLFFGGLAEQGPVSITGACSAAMSPSTDADIAVLRYSIALGATWPCDGGAFIYTQPGDQYLDAIVPLQGSDGGAIIAGRTGGRLDLGGASPYDGTPAIFVARLDGTTGRSTTWVKVISVTHLPSDPVHLEIDPAFTAILLSGTFDGMLVTDKTITSSNPAGFATLLDLSGGFTWTGAMLPCEASGSTTLIASFATPTKLAIAGTLSGQSQFAGELFDPGGDGTAFYVARVDHK